MIIEYDRVSISLEFYQLSPSTFYACLHYRTHVKPHMYVGLCKMTYRENLVCSLLVYTTKNRVVVNERRME